MEPVRAPWWDTCIHRHTAPFYSSKQKATSASEDEQSNRVTSRDASGYFIWGDRVRIRTGDVDQDEVVKVAGRGREVWIRPEHLGGDPLLEVYVIDVGQGDGLLVVSPEGHHIMVDGGNTRKFQNAGKNAADFVDWKFYKEYLNRSERSDDDKATIRLDAVVASHNDIDHFGGILDLLDFKKKANDAELDCKSVKVETFYHAGLSWWFNGLDSRGRKKRTLGDPDDGFYTKLLDDRDSAVAATENLSDPDFDTLNGAWGSCVKAAVRCKKASAPGEPTHIERLTTVSHDWLPGFAPGNPDSAISIRVLGPVAETLDSGAVGLKKFPDGNSKNTNGHSVVLRVDYGDRKLLLTGDLNTHAQRYIMEQYGDEFSSEYGCDMAKGCHHGSRDVSYAFLAGLEPVATVISSGDAETHDHPRPTIVAASAITGRKLIDESGESLIMPLVYMTEVSRSYALGKLDELRVVDGLVYGLVNVRTDGKTLLFASMEEKGADWSVTALSDQQIRQAKVELATFDPDIE